MEVRLVLGTAVATAAGGALAGLLGMAAGLTTLDAGVGLAARALVVALVLVAVPVLLARPRVLSERRRTLVRSGVAGLVLGYALDPFAWSGRAFFAQVLLEPGSAAGLVDLGAWTALGAGAVSVATRSAAREDEPLGYRA